MPRKRAKRTVKQPASPPGGDEERPSERAHDDASTDMEVEKRVAAIRAIRDVQIEHLLTELRLLRSCMTEEQMGSPVLQFFTENLPHLSFDLDREDGQFEVREGNKDGKLCLDNTDGKTLHASFLHRMSIAHPGNSDAVPYFGGFEFSRKAGLLSTENLQVRDFVSDEPSDYQMLGLPDTLRTPGLSSQRLSIGMTPKTLRLPKPGEMLLSVRGSPLGVYKEENMEVINESDED
ncbi:uncharacterized protein LOC115739351 isoform X3 [Rhodamnia argentea]|uniref:Uncharacterized protein LOC115739351 isoform X3 n=1 Tax=Rhodamnia argentea TaxID=178133 RepID=A0ABM3GWJ2_9MYRT|nr:uncharacterized protein LOC115739351 isoform X3 [Rhodamnia argentea]